MIKRTLFFLILVSFFITPSFTHAGLLSDLKALINKRAEEIKQINKEIEEYKERVEETQQEARSLQGEISELDASERRIQGNISSTQSKINYTVSTIHSLESEISQRKKEIVDNTEDLSQTLRILNELESRSLVEIVFSEKSFSGFLDNIETIGRFQSNVHTSIEELTALQKTLEEKRNEHESERRSLISYQQQLSDQKRLVEINQQSKERLLDETKNKEANYQKILEERLAKKEALEKEILEFEERLRIEIDPNSLPNTGTGVLAWPLDSIYITQYFGNTPFATKNAQIYSGAGHTGVDFRAKTGTPVRSSSNGVVRGVANTDSQCYRVSYGKWILVEHFNGLSTLYAHLSLQSVSVGQEVQAGQIIGYSGNTGYSTGPHLHYAVFATKAVGISGIDTEPYISRVCGVELTLPVSAKNGYLNPLSYLPALE